MKKYEMKTRDVPGYGLHTYRGLSDEYLDLWVKVYIDLLAGLRPELRELVQKETTRGRRAKRQLEKLAHAMIGAGLRPDGVDFDVPPHRDQRPTSRERRVKQLDRRAERQHTLDRRTFGWDEGHTPM